MVLKNRMLQSSFLFFCIFFVWKTKLSDLRFISIQNKFVVFAPKKDPPRIAFEEVFLTSDENIKGENDEAETKSYPTINLNTTPSVHSLANALRNKNFVLKKMVLSRGDFESKSNNDERFEIGQKISELSNKYLTTGLFNNNNIIIQSKDSEGNILTRQKLQPNPGPDEITKLIKPKVYTLSGSLKLLGEAFGEDRRLEVFRSKEGHIVDQGVVNVQDATFVLNTEELSGTLVAQLVDQHNSVIAQSSHIIDNNNQKESTFVLELSPQNLSFNDKREVSVYGFKGVPINKSKTNTTINSINHGSTLLAYTNGNNTYPGVHIVSNSGRPQPLPAYRKSMIRALLEISKEIQTFSFAPENNSIVWGQVLFEGKPAAGIKVRIEGEADFHPLYFNSLLIPESRLTETTENGTFAFVHLPTGFYSVTAEKGNQYFSHGNIWVEDGAISSLSLESLIKKNKIEIKTYDAFSGKPLDSQIRMQSIPDSFDISGSYSVYLPPINRISLLFATPYLYGHLPLCTSYSDASEYIHLPLIENDWLDSILSQGDAAPAPEETEHGYLIGFIQNTDFQAKLILDNENETEISPIYFDASGRRVPTGVSGGGYLFTEVPLGLASVQIFHLRSKTTTNLLVPIQAGYMNLAPSRTIEYY